MTEESDPLKPLWNKAREAAANGDYPGLLFVWKALADKGVWEIYAGIGELYERGAKGVDRDFEQALYWYRKAVFEGDDPVGHLGLGMAYFNGTGVERDYVSALKHFQRADAFNLPQAGIFLGVMYYRGAAVPRDLRRAEEYFQAAAVGDYPLAYVFLARIALLKGRLFKAMKLFWKATNLTLRFAKKDLDDPKLLGLDEKLKNK